MKYDFWCFKFLDVFLSCQLLPQRPTPLTVKSPTDILYITSEVANCLLARYGESVTYYRGSWDLHLATSLRRRQAAATLFPPRLFIKLSSRHLSKFCKVSPRSRRVATKLNTASSGIPAADTHYHRFWCSIKRLEPFYWFDIQPGLEPWSYIICGVLNGLVLLFASHDPSSSEE